uniref:Uncharacterized protein n=1 Tax=Arundo donax TaxID=35708 RepID=A0A0A9AVX8_ARUDO
MCRLSIVLNF